jgi:indolepyruvate ferredoxin oxidoreductase
MKLSDKFTLERGIVYLTGIQALVRLPLDQIRRDARNGLKTGAFISGYEGSPLGTYDLALARVKKLLLEHNIHFQPGVNEDLAATSVLGSQIIEVLGKTKVDGVVGIWYGKGPGVDRSGDIFRHANLAGTGRNSAALVLAGDDHSCKSSTIPHQSDFSLMNVGIPFFYPGNVQEVLDYGLMAIALSRYSGAWVGMKMVTDVCDGGGTVTVDSEGPGLVLPEGYLKHTDARVVAPISLALEAEVNIRRLEAARDFARANGVNRWYGARERAWLGIATAGKSYYDLAQALRDLGLGERDLESLGIRVAKFGMTFPLEPRFAVDFATGLEALLVIEEKRSFLEMQLKDALYPMRDRPLVVGKTDENGVPLFPPIGELDPDRIARVVGELIARRYPIESVLARLDRIAAVLGRPRELLNVRAPNFCSGCPHNRSTLLLDGQAAGGGIGCHTMAMRLTGSNRTFSFLTHMGGEGAPWIGMSPFVERQHVFQNIGDGTYFHSGQLAVEACVAAGVNITYKILYNGHVAMTGGQEAAGALPVPALTRKLEAEGVRKTVVLAEDVSRYEGASLAMNAEVRDRSELLATLAEMEKIPGVTAIIYDQECAAEKRRKRSRGKLEEPTSRLVINEDVCEGCGDCVKQSNCMSLNPVSTEFGDKMRIHQSSCNKDYSCALGDCPSFVTVKIRPGTGLRKPPVPTLPPAEVPAPARFVEIGESGYRIFLPGIGGTGVVTMNALLAAAAWIEGLSAVTLDQTGTAQKGGAVVSHILLSRKVIAVPARTNIGNADLILGFDLIGAANPDNLRVATAERTVAVLNTDLVPTVDSIRSRTVLHGPERMLAQVSQVTRPGHNICVDANRLAESLFGTHLAANVFLLGVAWQAGLVPVSLESLDQAIEWNGVEVEKNRQAFLWGRKYYHDAAWVEAQVAQPRQTGATPAEDPIDLRVRELRAYQNEAKAQEYAEFVGEVGRRAPDLQVTVARNLYKLMAFKDEYEVARLLTRPQFLRTLRDQWEAVESISYNLHPPFLRRFGVSKKLTLGGWFAGPLRVLAGLKFLRGTPFDVFGWSAHRRMERSLAGWYKDLVRQLLECWDETNPTPFIEIAALPEQIRGYERLKERSVEDVKKAAEQKLAAIKAAVPAHSAR